MAEPELEPELVRLQYTITDRWMEGISGGTGGAKAGRFVRLNQYLLAMKEEMRGGPVTLPGPILEKTVGVNQNHKPE